MQQGKKQRLFPLGSFLNRFEKLVRTLDRHLLQLFSRFPVKRGCIQILFLLSRMTASQYIFALVILLSGSPLTFSQDDDCPFTNGICPVTLDNVVDVFFHDITDRISCQRECRSVARHNHWHADILTLSINFLGQLRTANSSPCLVLTTTQLIT